MVAILVPCAHGKDASATTLSRLLTNAFPALPDPSDVAGISRWLHSTARLSSRITVSVIGYSSQDREILGVVDEGDMLPRHVVPTVAIICRQHGDESAPTLAALELIFILLQTLIPIKTICCNKCDSSSFPSPVLTGRLRIIVSYRVERISIETGAFFNCLKRDASKLICEKKIPMYCWIATSCSRETMKRILTLSLRRGVQNWRSAS